MAVTAEVVLPASAAQGVIIAQGGAFGGWSFYTKDGRLKFCYNLFGLQRFTTASTSSLSAGKHQVRMEFAYAGGGLAKGGAVTLYIDGQKAAKGSCPPRSRWPFPRMKRAMSGAKPAQASAMTIPPRRASSTASSTGFNSIRAQMTTIICHARKRLTVAMARQ